MPEEILHAVVRCKVCNIDHPLVIPAKDYLAWRGGELIQRAMPYLDASTRELLISGICGPCFDNLFAEEP